MTRDERAYYDQRAREYDDWYHGTGLFAERDRPGWHEEVARLIQTVSAIRASSVLDVACGTGFLTRHLRGRITAHDQSLAMLRIARERLPNAQLVQGDALCLPFRSASFECLLAAHFYGHVRQESRADFLREARRVASRVVVVDAACRPGIEHEQVQERILNDGTRHHVYKRYFTPEQMLDEVGGGRVLLAGEWFVAVEKSFRDT